MGYIKKLKNNELVGGTDKTTIYPVTSAEAVFEEVSDGEFKSQKYLNNHITNERIVDNTIENRKLKDGTIDMGKLNTQLKTIIQNAYDASWKVKEEPFSLETKYDANDVVYDPATNSSYVSLTADNQGNPVKLEDEEAVNPYWRLVINGISAIESTAVINAKVTELEEQVDDKIDDAQGQLDQMIADAADSLADAESDARGAAAEASAVVANKVANAQIGYYECTTAAGTAKKQTTSSTVGDSTYTVPATGSLVKIKMQYATTSTTDATLQFGNLTSTEHPLYYNGEPASASNSWEDGEVISVYFDGTNYQASNSQGGGGKAEKIKYDNSQSRLVADNVQEAVDDFVETIGLDLAKSDITKAFDSAGWESKKAVASESNGIVNIGDVFSSSSNTSYASGFVDVSKYDYINISLPQINQVGAIFGACFYDEDNNPLSGITKASLSPAGMYSYNCKVPDGAKYIRTTKRTDTGFAQFSCYGLNLTSKASDKVLMRGVNGWGINITQAITSGVPVGSASVDGSTTYIEKDAKEGDVIKITARGGNNVRAWAFIDSDRNLISYEDAGVFLEDKVIVAPANTDKVILNAVINGANGYPDYKWYFAKKGSVAANLILESYKKEISILFIGNSLTQDAVTYVPLLLRELAPNLKFNLHIWYNGGYTLSQHLADFNNNKACEIFSVCNNGESWTNYNNSITMDYVLSNFKYDVISIQEYFNYQEVTDVSTFNSIVSYIENHHARPFKVVTLFHQPKRLDLFTAKDIFNRTKAGNALFLKETVAEDMIPSGISIYRALSTDLDSLGDVGHLSPDNVHSQEGLPCMMQAYVTAMWILNRLGIQTSINDASSIVDSSNYDSLNIPGPNLGTGVVVGTEEQVRLSQYIAINAFKEGEDFVRENTKQKHSEDNISDIGEDTIIIQNDNITRSFNTAGWTNKQFIAGKSFNDTTVGDMEASSSKYSYASGYVDISRYDHINITMPQINQRDAALGACFYDEEYVPISGVLKPELASGMVAYTFAVPENAKYIRTTKRTDSGFAEFACYGIVSSTAKEKAEELDVFVNPVKHIPFKLSNGGINASGAYFFNDGLKVTDAIDVSNMQYIYYSREQTPTGDTFLAASFFDENNNFICGESAAVGNNKYIPSVIAKPDGAKYVRMCFFNSNTYGRRQILNVTDAEIGERTIWKTIDNLTFTDAKLINSANGIVSTSTSHKCTEDYIDIKDFRGGKMFYPRIYFNSDTQILAGIAFYNKEKKYITGLAAKVGTFDANHHVKTTVDIPDNAYFVRVSALSDSEDAFDITLCTFNSLYDKTESEVKTDDYDYSYGESESRFRFYKAMEEKLDNYGITNYIIEGPGGYGRSDNANEIPNPVLGHGMCQLPLYGLAKIVSMALNYPTLADIWASTSHIIRTKGVEEEVTVTKSLNGTYGHYLTDYYTILSWKTGTDDANPIRNLYCTATNDTLKGQVLTGVISFHRNFENDTYNRYKAMKLLLDIGAAKFLDRSADTSELETALIAQDISHAQVIVCPTYGRFMKDWDLNNSNYYQLYDYHGGSETVNTMSMAKLLTAEVVLDYVKDLDAYCEITANDLYWGQYPIDVHTFSEGCKVTYRDLLYALLFPSWNQAAYCLARNVGNYLLRTYRGDHFISNE